MTAYAFTGPRTAGEAFRPYVRECLSMLEPSTVITGCAPGIDTIVAEEALDLFPTAHHVLVVPNGPHNEELVRSFEALSAAGEFIIEVATVYPRMQEDPFRGRNEYMVGRCRVLGAFPGTRRFERGGTWMTINIARAARRQVVVFPLEDAAPSVAS